MSCQPWFVCLWLALSALESLSLRQCECSGSIGLSVAGIISPRSILRLCECHVSLGLFVSPRIILRLCEFYGSIGLSVAGIVSPRSILRLCECHVSLGLFVSPRIILRLCEFQWQYWFVCSFGWHCHHHHLSVLS